MKCSNCGNNNLKKVSMEKQFCDVWGDASLRPVAETFICLDCGHLEFFNCQYASDYKAKQKTNEEINQKIEETKSQIKKLKETKFDTTIFEKETERLEKEIKTLESMGISGKEIRYRKDGIKENKEILEKKIDPKLEQKIKDLERDIVKLQSQIVQL